MKGLSYGSTRHILRRRSFRYYDVLRRRRDRRWSGDHITRTVDRSAESVVSCRILVVVHMLRPVERAGRGLLTVRYGNREHHRYGNRLLLVVKRGVLSVPRRRFSIGGTSDSSCT